MINYLKNLVKKHIVKYVLLQLIIIFSISVLIVPAQNDTTRTKEKTHSTHKDDISLFGSDEILNVSLYLDLGSFSKKPSKSDSFDADMTIHINDFDSINRQVTIKYRGISRFDICNFPPMQINFKKPLYSDSLKIKKLKLVTH